MILFLFSHPSKLSNISIINRFKRNKVVLYDFEINIIILIIDVIKKKYKSAIKFKFGKKLKKPDFKFKRKTLKNNAIKNIFNYSLIMKEKVFKKVSKSFIYIINISVL